ncbi:hypothetical protein SAMN05216357_12427 [Porphyromonadaceae bacterium KH3CP3RA]|nr:hypothetical protein SAMN05216357_12427 [Porphyromonadaceae bacterium KH3CP3RA]
MKKKLEYINLLIVVDIQKKTGQDVTDEELNIHCLSLPYQKYKGNS